MRQSSPKTDPVTVTVTVVWCYASLERIKR